MRSCLLAKFIGSDSVSAHSSIRAASVSVVLKRWIDCRLRSAFFLLCLLLPSVGWAENATETDAATLTTLRNQTRELLRSESLLKDSQEKDDALTALCDLYVVLRRDDRFAQSEMLQEDVGKIRRRLLTLASKKKGRLRRDRVPRPDSLSADVDAAIADAMKPKDDEAVGKDASQKGIGGNDAATPESDVSANTSAAKMKPIKGFRAGASAAGGGNAAGGADNGWQLVELVQRIVAPDFWEVNGGPGAVHYFAMRRLLVVRATSDVHQQIRELLLKLPR